MEIEPGEKKTNLPVYSHPSPLLTKHIQIKTLNIWYLCIRTLRTCLFVVPLSRLESAPEGYGTGEGYIGSGMDNKSPRQVPREMPGAALILDSSFNHQKIFIEDFLTKYFPLFFFVLWALLLRHINRGVKCILDDSH